MHIKIESVEFKSDGLRLSGDFYIPVGQSGRGSFPGVIFYHGKGSGKHDYIDRAEALAEEGIAALAFDFRGVGESEGEEAEVTNNSGIIDGLAAYDFLIADSRINPDRIGVCGRSFGGYVSAVVSAERPVKSILLAHPAIYEDAWGDRLYDSISKEDIKTFRNQGDLFGTKAIAAIQEFSGAMMIIGGRKDDIAPKRVIETYFDQAKMAQKREVEMFPGQHLLSPAEKDNFKKIIVRWFKGTL